jgi:type III pantothenate kinase
LLLAINIGNTNVQCGVFSGPSVARSERFPAGDEARLAAFLASCPAVEAAVASSVNQPVCGVVSSAVSLVLKTRLLLAGKDFQIPIPNRTRFPEKVGSDRLLNSLAAYARAKNTSLVIDIGTAITIDVVNARGHFLGGVIMPGPMTAISALHSGTAMLPEISLPLDVPVLGQDTEGAIASGVFWGTAGAVEKILGMLKMEFGDDAATFLTGGGAERFAGTIRGIDHVIPELTLEGLRIAYSHK